MMRRIKSVLDVLSTLIVIATAGALLWRLASPPQRPPGQRPPIETVKDLSLTFAEPSHVRGTGEVVLVEFADYECPFCARHAQMTGPLIKKQFVDSGIIRELFINFPLPIHPKAQKAGEAAECAANQGKFWDMHDALFAESTALDVGDLTRRAEHIGLERTTFSKCLDQNETAAVIRRDVKEGRRLAVDATPAFFVGLARQDGTIDLRKRINGAAPFEEFAKAVEELIPGRHARSNFPRLFQIPM